MTKKEAEREFSQMYPGIEKSTDIPQRNEAWGIFIDGLCKEGRITSKQYHNWGYPTKWKQYNYGKK